MKSLCQYENSQIYKQRNKLQLTDKNNASHWQDMATNPWDYSDLMDGEQKTFSMALDEEDYHKLNHNLLIELLKDNGSDVAKYMAIALKEYRDNPDAISDYGRYCLLRAKQQLLTEQDLKDVHFLNQTYQSLEEVMLLRDDQSDNVSAAEGMTSH
ncbi:MAG: hypothetical protein GY821_07705 [Gammaproteobacteria bacterium]|nr:hypothetical protein [Gammaproteobacteria bacterium]